MSDYIKSLIRSIDLGFPFVAVTTPDYPDTMRAIKEAASEYALLHWDMARGAIGVNDRGAEAQAAINAGEEPAVTTAKFEECLQRALDLMPKQTVLVMDDVHLMLEHKDETIRALYIQSIRNCREAFKATERCLVFLCPSIKLPAELVNDVEIIQAPLPDEAAINAKTIEICKSAQAPAPDENTLKRVADALLGLTMFAAENAMAKCIGKSGFDYEALWATKRSFIRQVGGLSIPETTSSFDQLGGLGYLKAIGRKIINGKRKPKLVVLLDEVEKQMSGLGDSNGINQDCFGQILQGMNDNDWEGILLPGFPGTGKTEWAKAMGTEAGGMFLSLDLGSVKGGLVGDSERMIRSALSTLKAMGGDKVLFVSTCNSMDDLRPEFISRQEDIVFCDLYEKAERDVIFKIHMKKFGLEEQALPEADGWAGREIRNCVKKAWKYNSTLIEEAKFIIPNRGVKDTLRAKAEKEGWLSAETGQPYKQKNKKAVSMGSLRKMQKPENN